MDVYYPPDETDDSRWPAVIIVAGYPGTMEPRPTTLTYKEIGWTVSMCRLIAVSGMVAIAYTNRDPVADLQALFEHIHECAESLRIDPARGRGHRSVGERPDSPHDHHAGRQSNAGLRGVRLRMSARSRWRDRRGRCGAAVWLRKPRRRPHVCGSSTGCAALITRAGRDQFPAMNASIDSFIRHGLDRESPDNLREPCRRPTRL